MKVAVRYCGGCNSGYDRAALVERFKKENPTWDFEYAKEDTTYDKLLVVGGCSNCCAAYEMYDAAEVYKVWTEKGELLRVK